jgi:hypothetical protein
MFMKFIDIDIDIDIDESAVLGTVGEPVINLNFVVKTRTLP